VIVLHFHQVKHESVIRSLENNKTRSVGTSTESLDQEDDSKLKAKLLNSYVLDPYFISIFSCMKLLFV